MKMPPIPTKQLSNDSNEIEMEIEESMIDGNQPEYLRAYYQFLFPHTLFFQWLSYANGLFCFVFFLFYSSTMIRHWIDLQ